MLQNKKIDNNKWLLSSEFKKPDKISIELINAEIIKFSKEYSADTNILYLISKITYLFANDPWLKQKEVQSILDIDIKTLKTLNEIIRKSDYLLNLITKSGTANKYWQTIAKKAVISSLPREKSKNVFNFKQKIDLFESISQLNLFLV